VEELESVLKYPMTTVTDVSAIAVGKYFPAIMYRLIINITVTVSLSLNRLCLVNAIGNMYYNL